LSILSNVISARQARDVARSLKHMGYRRATIKLCRGHSVTDLAGYLEPDRSGDDYKRLCREIAVAANLQPKGEVNGV
jgi:hypothetical protein